MIPQRHIRAFQARYHRNGTTGEGFFLCEFKWLDGSKLRDMRAVVFSEPGRIAIISHSINERWLGDDFEPAIREALAAVEKAQPESLYADSAA